MTDRPSTASTPSPRILDDPVEHEPQPSTPSPEGAEPREPRLDALGSNHVLRYHAEMIERWHDDPNLDCRAEARKVMEESSKLHRLLVAMGEREAALPEPPTPHNHNPAAQGLHSPATPDSAADGAVGGAQPFPLPCPYCDSPDGSKWHRPVCVEAALPEPSLDMERLQRISALQPEAVEMLRRHGFVMDRVGPLDDNATELDRWKMLAFSLYTDIVEASVTADHILEAWSDAAD